MADEVLYERRDRVALITLNRPEYANAQNSAMTYALDAAFARAVNSQDVAVIVLAGEGEPPPASLAMLASHALASRARFDVTLGDELQCLLIDARKVWDISHYVRYKFPEVDWVVACGRGTITTALTPGITAVVVAEAKRLPAKPTGIALNEMRFRSYPSFTRVVVETANALPYAVATNGDEVRVQLTRLTLGAVRTQEIADAMGVSNSAIKTRLFRAHAGGHHLPEERPYHFRRQGHGKRAACLL